ncbi:MULTISPECIES: hypothetical protein [unclassified Streptomyces]|uniref:hypothetical protein n=1 Tax=unclassified Streptomyces TaxID=2593676 RepID=UPI0022B65378|nr:MULTISPECIES: hypothetical protein [unclassified Streptomyces]MCZ7413221.1 hypothetical protein [Streptomyces sp. WMMC897]MCZ7430214.1 hypothetical protein [Streptomyces sp. WMMC1477]
MAWRTLAHGRIVARSFGDGAADVLHPLLVLGRGAARLTAMARSWWEGAGREQHGPALFLAAACGLFLWVVPYGLWLAGAAAAGAAAWFGRRPEEVAEPPEPEPDPAERAARLQALYEALVPCLAVPEDAHPEPLYAADGSWERVFTSHAFDEDGRLARLVLRYPPSFPDGEAEARMRVQRLLCAKAGRARELRFDWDEEANELRVTALAPLPPGICVQRFVVAPGEMVLGFTDGEAVQRTLPVLDGGESRDVPPVVWRTGPRSTEPHLLALGQPGAGTTSLLRSVALQALQHGDVLVVDGSGAGEYACLTGRRGVLSVETTLVGALASLQWAAHETERRLLAAVHAREGGRPQDEVRRPLWVLVDRPAVLSHLARAEGRADPQELLEVVLRHGRAARVSVALAEQFEGAEALAQVVRAYTRARVVLGAASPEQVRAVLGEPPQTTPVRDGVPPGRGYARLGTGPVLRLQVPAAPDPYDELAAEAHRQAVLALLPETVVGVEECAPRSSAPGGGEGAEGEGVCVSGERVEG